MPLVPDGNQYLPRPLDHFDQLRALAAKGQADRVLSIQVLVAQPIADNGIGLATTPSATKANVVNRAGDELGLFDLGLPDYCSFVVAGFVVGFTGFTKVIHSSTVFAGVGARAT